MTGTIPLSLGNDLGLALVIDLNPFAKCLVPPTHADHLVVFFPTAKGVVGGVDDNQTNFSFFKATFQIRVKGIGPRGAVVIAHDDIIVFQTGGKGNGWID